MHVLASATRLAVVLTSLGLTLGTWPPITANADPVPGTQASPIPSSSQTVDVPAGDEIGVVLLGNIDSRISNEGDAFAVETVSDYYWQGHLILPKGTPGYGVITHVKHAGLFHAGGELSIAVRRLIAPDGHEFTVEIRGATGDANRDVEVNGNSFGQYLLWGLAGLLTKRGNDILLKKGTEFHVVTSENPTAAIVPIGAKPAALDAAMAASSGQ
jgi:hypothetical protein